MNEKEQISYSDFLKLDIRIGTIVEAQSFPEANKPAYKLKIDFGKKGIKRSSAQITDYYSPSSLIGRQVIAVVNFPIKQIANFFSECLVLGVEDEHQKIVLLTTETKVENGLAIS